MSRVGMGLAVGAGYLLGRTRKLKLAVAVGTLVAGKRMNLSPRAVADLVSRQLWDNPQFKEIGDQLRQDLRGVGRAASGAMIERRIDSLADRLHSRTARMRDELAGGAQRAPGAGRDGADDPDVYEDEDEDEDGYEGPEDAEEPAGDEGRGDRGRAQPSSPGRSGGRGGPGGREAAGTAPAKKAAKEAPAKKTAKKAPAKKTAAKKTTAKKAPVKKAAAKKAGAAKKTAGRAARGAAQSKGGGER
ncbi:DNA primase [Streptomyces sp. NPDC052020]|uniref:DNA primase n=1 Tax=Streptomyces sp. NPDC052020 TaxID=3155677 RepID=UPI00341C5E64